MPRKKKNLPLGDVGYSDAPKDSERKPNPKSDKLTQIRKRYKMASEADNENRVKAIDDMKFVHLEDAQWDSQVLKDRGLRPHYTYNKTRVTIKRVVNDMRANRPSGKVRGTEEADKDTAETLEGLIRNIWNVSDGDTVIDAAAEYQVGGGMGAWRVSVDYAGDSAFDQEIKIEEIRNPFCLYADPACQDPLKRDARYWILTSRISKTAFEAKWPDQEQVNFEPDVEFDDDDDWEDADSVRIVEYWYKEPIDKTVYLLPDGQTVEELPPGIEPLKERKVKSSRIKMCIASGKSILEEADWAGAEFPFILVYGESVIIDGKHHWFGLTRFAKDPARSYNYAMTSIIEKTALSSQAKWWATPKQAEGHIDKWNVAHKENIPFMLANNDPNQPGFPQAMQPSTVEPGLMAIAQMASEDIKAVTGIFDASLGKQGNETSGVAISARQQQGEIAVFNYMDNLAKGIRRTWEILVDLIPKIYDTERAVRILGQDGGEKYAKLNSFDPATGQGINDLSRGKYDVNVTTGPSYATKRQESSEIFMQLLQSLPAQAPLIADLAVKNMDVPGADQLANRLKLMLPPQIQESEKGDKPIPPEVQNMMMQAQQAMQMVQEQAQAVQEEGGKVALEKADIMKQQAALQAKFAELKSFTVEKDAEFTKAGADLTKREAAFILKQAQAGQDEAGKAVESDRAALSEQVGGLGAQFEQKFAEFMQQAVATLSQIRAEAQPQTIVTDRPKRKITRMKKVGGGMYEAESIEVPADPATV